MLIKDLMCFLVINPPPGYLFVKAEDVVWLREEVWGAAGAEVAHRRTGSRAVLGELRGPTWASGVLSFS